MRLFAALPLPPAAVRGISDAFAPARRMFPAARWVAPEGMHLTLQFFGEVSSAAAASLREVFRDPSLVGSPVRTCLAAPGQFPARGLPRVIWAGLGAGAREMRALQADLAVRIAPLSAVGGPLDGWEPDSRTLSPHVTVARCGTTPVDPSWAGMVEMPPLDFEISECVLFQSFLGPSGARYEPLERILLGGANA